VGGSTSGKATMAPIGPRSQELVRDNHRAIGVPTTSRIAVVRDASFRVSQIAAKSALVSDI
jgi:hypothetical protein